MFDTTPSFALRKSWGHRCLVPLEEHPGFVASLAKAAIDFPERSDHIRATENPEATVNVVAELIESARKEVAVCFGAPWRGLLQAPQVNEAFASFLRLPNVRLRLIVAGQLCELHSGDYTSLMNDSRQTAWRPLQHPPAGETRMNRFVINDLNGWWHNYYGTDPTDFRSRYCFRDRTAGGHWSEFERLYECR